MIPGYLAVRNAEPFSERAQLFVRDHASPTVSVQSSVSRASTMAS